MHSHQTVVILSAGNLASLSLVLYLQVHHVHKLGSLLLYLMARKQIKLYNHELFDQIKHLTYQFNFKS